MKKTSNKIYALLGVTALVLLANACLKDDRFVDFSKVGTVIELMDAAPGGTAVVQAPLVASTLPDTIWVRVNATGPNKLTKDVTVTLAIGDASSLTTLGDSTAVLLPDSTYTVPSTTITLKAGSRAGSFPILVNSGKVDLTQNFILPVKITNAQGETVSGNLGLILFHVTVKNIYDGFYHSVGQRFNFAQASDYTGWDAVNNQALGTIVSKPTWDFPATHIGTVNSNTSYVHVGNNDGGFGTMNITVNPDNTVTVASDPINTGVANLVPLSGGPISTYDPATKTFTLHYQYTNASGTHRVLYDVLTLNP